MSPLPLQSTREINAAEESAPRAGVLKFGPDGLEINLKPYQPRTIAFRFKNGPKTGATIYQSGHLNSATCVDQAGHDLRQRNRRIDHPSTKRTGVQILLRSNEAQLKVR